MKQNSVFSFFVNTLITMCMCIISNFLYKIKDSKHYLDGLLIFLNDIEEN